MQRERKDGTSLDRRGFVKRVGLGAGGLALGSAGAAPAPTLSPEAARALSDAQWPSLRHYDADHVLRIALPIGGIGTGTVSLGGRGDLRDFEIMNRPGKGFVPAAAAAPFFALRVREAGKPPQARVLEGPLPEEDLEGSHGSPAPNAGLPRFRTASFASAYPFGRVLLSDPDLPVEAQLKAMNPLVPADPEASGLPVAVFRVELRNRTGAAVEAAVCVSLPNFVGMDGSKAKKDWKGDPQVVGAAANRNAFRRTDAAQGLFLSSEKVDPADPAWGSHRPRHGARRRRHLPHGLGRGGLVRRAPRLLGRPAGRRPARRAPPERDRHADGLPAGPARPRSRRDARGPLPPRLALPEPLLLDAEGRPAGTGGTGSATTTRRGSRTRGTSPRGRCRAFPSCTAARSPSSRPSWRATCRPR